MQVEEVTDAFLTLDASELEIKDEVEMVKQQKKPSKAQKRRVGNAYFSNWPFSALDFQ